MVMGLQQAGLLKVLTRNNEKTFYTHIVAFDKILFVNKGMKYHL